MVLGKLPVPVHRGIINLDDSRTRASCTCGGCGWGVFGHHYSQISFLSSFSLSSSPSYIILRIQRLEDKQCRSR